jgi:hypothetical protein
MQSTNKLIMNKLKLVIISIFCIVSFVQCRTKTNTAESKSSIIINDTIKSNKLQNKKIENSLIGKWFIPHSADINITFNEDRTFIFNDFNIKTEEMEVLHGTFELSSNKLILKYNDRPQQTFRFEKGKGADDNYYITKGENYYFVKSDL